MAPRKCELVFLLPLTVVVLAIYSVVYITPSMVLADAMPLIHSFINLPNSAHEGLRTVLGSHGPSWGFGSGREQQPISYSHTGNSKCSGDGMRTLGGI